MILDPRRIAVVAEVMEWIGTPYHHAARLKGVGCDCLTLLTEVYERAGVVPRQEVPFYRPDFMQHQSEETYLSGLLEHGREVEVPMPADVVVYRWGRIFAHAGIIVDWPWIVHADVSNGVIRARGNTGRLMGRDRKFISAFDDGSAP